MAEIRYKLVTNIEPSFSRTSKKRCFRVGGKRGTRCDSLPLKTVQLVEPGEKRWQHACVYQVSISPDLRDRWPKQPPNFYVVSLTAEALHSYLVKRFGNIAHNHMGVAHLALTEAMAAVSTRPSAGRVGKHARDIVKGAVFVTSTDGKDVYEVTVADNLKFAVSALQNGRASIDMAYKRAANRIAGRLRNFGNHILDPDLQTPFPEVQRKK